MTRHLCAWLVGLFVLVGCAAAPPAEAGRFKLLLGRFPVLLHDLSLSSQTFDTSTTDPGDTIATISGKTVGSTLTLIPDDGVMEFNIGQTALVRGEASVLAGNYTYQIAETLATASNSPKYNVFPFTIVTTPTGVPNLRNWTMNRGALTLAASGGVPLGQLMQTSGDAVTTWTWSGQTTGLTLNASTGAITPTANGGFGATDRTITITGTNAAGADSATLTIHSVPNAYSASSIADLGSTKLGNVGVKAGLGGKTILLSYGMAANLASTSDQLLVNAWNTHTGRIAMTSEFYDDPTKYTTIRIVRFTNNSTRIDVSKLNGEPYLPSSNNNGNNQNVGAFRFTTVSDITLDHAFAGAPIADAPFTQQWMGGVQISTSSNITVTNFRAVRTKNAITVGDSTGVTFDNFVLDTFVSSGVFGSDNAYSNNTYRNGIILRGFKSGILIEAQKDHQDNFQNGSRVPIGTRTQSYSNNSVYNVRMYNADGNGAPQLPFMNGVGTNPPGVPTGYSQNYWTYTNVFGAGFKANPVFDIGYGNILSNSVYLRAPYSAALGVAVPAINSPSWQQIGLGAPNMFNPLIVLETAGAGVQGTSTGVVYTGSLSAGSYPGFPGIVANNVSMIDQAALPGTVTQTSQNDNDLLAYYASLNLYNDPLSLVGFDYANSTAEQIDAAYNLAFRAKLNGGLKQPDGSYWGMWNPDGTLATVGVPYVP